MVRLKRYILGVLALFALGAPLTSNGETVVSIDSAISLALERNLDLVAARKTIAEAEARLAATGKWSNPELEAGVAVGPERQNTLSIGFTQAFPLTSRLRLERAVSAAELEKARAEIALKEWQLSGEVRVAVINHIAAREALTLTEAQVNTATRVSSFTAERVKEGHASSLESATALLEQRRLESELIAQRTELTSAAATLAKFLVVHEVSEIQTTGNLALPASSKGDAPSVAPAITVAAASAEAGKREIELAEARRWQDLSAGLVVQRERSVDEPDGLGTEVFAGIQFSLPLPLWNSGKAAVQEKVAAAERLEAELAATTQTVEINAHTTLAVMEARYKVAQELNGELLELARKQISDYEAAYDRGEIGFEEVFRARERSTALEVSALTARKEFHLARARWMAGMAHN
jgi:cobalt-zinc-cadmium efflux system outer membrane protein